MNSCCTANYGDVGPQDTNQRASYGRPYCGIWQSSPRSLRTGWTHAAHPLSLRDVIADVRRGEGWPVKGRETVAAMRDVSGRSPRVAALAERRQQHGVQPSALLRWTHLTRWDRSR